MLVWSETDRDQITTEVLFNRNIYTADINIYNVLSALLNKQTNK